MLVGEAPGEFEDLEGKPFVGRAGDQLNSLLNIANLPREEVFISNTVRCRPPRNATPKPHHVQACAKWLDLELSLVNPQIIVAMGATAIRRFLGNDFSSVENVHGKPVTLTLSGSPRIVLPCYHPAAAIHQTNTLRFLREDFQVLRGLLDGVSAESYIVQDEYPNPEYRVVSSPIELRRELSQCSEYGVDTETYGLGGRLWSVQFSTRPGTGLFVRIPDGFAGKFDLTDYRASAIVHNYSHDVKYLSIPDSRFTDSMTQAYILGLPQGLKELASRLCGMKMKTYSELTRPKQRTLSLQYLSEVLCREWPDPPVVEDSVWDNKVGKVVVKQHKPWHISRKVKKIITDCGASQDVDPLDRWKQIEEQERLCVEKVLGKMPESSLADVDFEEALLYSCKDPDATLRIKLKMDKLIHDLGLDFILNLDLSILPMVHEMMKNGMAVDLNHLRSLSSEYTERMASKADELAKIVGHSFNPASSPQVASVVYTELGFKPTSFTESGLISTDDQELKKTGHPVAKGVIEYRRLSKMKGTYTDNVMEYALPEPDGTYRIHTTINTTRTETGRLSSSSPINLQNIPTRSKEGKAVRKAFAAPDGRVLCEGDYGQIEVVVQAHLANCKGLIDLFNRGDDPHTVTAAKIFDVPYDEAKKDKYRYPTKRANFGIIYLMGAKGLSEQIAEYVADLLLEGEKVEVEPWDVPTCEKFISDWYKLYPEVKDYQLEMAAHARRYGYVRDVFGRIRYVPEVYSPVRMIQESGLKMAANMPVQSSAQNIMKIAMARAWEEYKVSPWRDQVRWIMQIHDSLITELPDDEEFITSFTQWLGGIMTSVVKLVVPIKVDFKVGKNWGEMEKYPKKKEEKK